MNFNEAIAGIDNAFAGATRPEHFTNYTHCCECSEEDIRWSEATRDSIEAERYPETLGISFLTRDGFHYFMPAFARRMTRGGPEYCVGDIVFHIENRLDQFSAEQLSAIRDLLYVAYEELSAEIDDSPFDYEMVWRVLNQLDGGNPDDTKESNR
jgi:hypothetical protein